MKMEQPLYREKKVIHVKGNPGVFRWVCDFVGTLMETEESAYMVVVVISLY